MGLVPHEAQVMRLLLPWNVQKKTLKTTPPYETHVSCVSVEFPEEDNEACGNLPESYCPDYFLMKTHVSFVSVECPEEDNESCGNLSESYCPDYFLMRHMCLLFQWSSQKRTTRPMATCPSPTARTTSS